MHCHACGQRNNVEARFCGWCGVAMARPAAAPSAPIETYETQPGSYATQPAPYAYPTTGTNPSYPVAPVPMPAYQQCADPSIPMSMGPSTGAVPPMGMQQAWPPSGPVPAPGPRTAYPAQSGYQQPQPYGYGYAGYAPASQPQVFNNGVAMPPMPAQQIVNNVVVTMPAAPPPSPAPSVVMMSDHSAFGGGTVAAVNPSGGVVVVAQRSNAMAVLGSAVGLAVMGLWLAVGVVVSAAASSAIPLALAALIALPLSLALLVVLAAHQSS